MYQIPHFVFPNLSHCISTKDEGSLSFNFHSEEKVKKNRLRFLEKAGIKPANCVGMRVEHSDGILIVTDINKGKGILDWESSLICDAMITTEKGLSLFLLIADCAPVIIYDPQKEVLGLVHIGWKNADINLIGKVIEVFMQKNSDPKDILVGIGPAARKDSFIKENPSQVNDLKWQPYIEKVEENRFKVDFVGLCKKQLFDGGVLEKNVVDCGVDTVKDFRFFSHVREHDMPKEVQGRFGCLVNLT